MSDRRGQSLQIERERLQDEIERERRVLAQAVADLRRQSWIRLGAAARERWLASARRHAWLLLPVTVLALLHSRRLARLASGLAVLLPLLHRAGLTDPRLLRSFTRRLA